MRRKQVSSEADGFEKVLSKEGSYYFNNVIMLISAVLVAYLTMASALPSWMPLGGQSIKAPAFDALARPLGIFYIMVMTICPILAWGGGDMKKLWDKAKMPVILGTALAAVVLLHAAVLHRRCELPDLVAPLHCIAGGGRRGLRDRTSAVALRRWRSQACGSHGYVVRLGARLAVHEGADTVGWVPHSPRHGCHPSRPGGIDHVRHHAPGGDPAGSGRLV
jgi:cytochrome c biogenesis factor